MALKSERRFISLSNLSSGMMIEFRYTKADSTAKSYTAIVIDPNKDSYLHALLLDNLSDSEIIQVATDLGREFNYDPDVRNAPITNLQSEEVYNRYKASQFKSERRYRTFLLSNISSLRQILIGEMK